MDALLLAFLNALWQGAAVIALVALALRWGLRRNATTACVVWSVAFVVIALLPALDLALARPAAAPTVHAGDEAFAVRIAAPGLRTRSSATTTTTTTTTATTATNAMTRPLARSPRRGDDALVPAVTMLERVRDGGLRIGSVATAFARAWGIAVAGAWALVATLLLLRLVRAYAAIAAMKRGATPLDDPAIHARLRAAGHRRRAAVACSPLVTIPCAVGFRRPMILVPAGLAASLDADDLARVVLHESAHLQRYDDWVNAIEQAVCALQFFQPALHLARRSIDFEREVACDDRVLEDAGEPLRYAECLARIVQRHVRGPQAAVVPGFVLRRAQVVARVRRIVDRSRDASPHLRLGAVALGGGVLIATLGIARLQVPVVAPAAATPVHAPAPEPAPRAHDVSRVAHTGRSAHANAPAHVVAHVDVPPADPAPAAPRAASTPAPAHRIAPSAAARPVHAVHTAVRATAPRPGTAPLPATAEQAAVLAAQQAQVAAHEVAAAETATRAAEGARTASAAQVAASVHAAAVAPVAAAQEAKAAAASAVTAANVQVRVVAQSSSGNAPALVRVSRSGGDLLDAIDEAKYPHPSVDELIALRNQGVSGDYVRRMGALGRSRPSLHEILALAVQGVTPEYIGALDRRLASQPSLDQVLALRVQGVSAAWLDGLAAIGYPRLSTDEAISLAVQGVSVSYVRGLMDAGMRSPTPAQLLALRVQGIDGTFVRRLAAHGYRNLDVNALIRLKASGFEP